MQNLKFIQQFFFLTLVSLSPATTTSQVVVGTGTPDASAAFEIQGTDRGLLLPRLTTAQRNGITSPATGLMIFNISTVCLEINIGTPAVPEWLQSGCRTGRVASVDCGGVGLSGNAVAGIPVTEAGFSVPYSGGNGGVFQLSTISSTGVDGLTATLLPGSFTDGSGTLSYTISGTPSGIGTANFLVSIGGQTCTVAYPVAPGTISALDCASAAVNGTLAAGVIATGTTVSVPYTGGNGGYYIAQTLASTGVTGLTATIAAGNFATGAGSLVYTISGTASSDGTAIFSLETGGKTCNLMLTVSVPACRAKIGAATYMAFMCHNLGAANTSADPFTPSWEINGGYWQWGRKEQAAAGPSGPGSGQANEGTVSGWSNANPPGNSWFSNTKTATDPCPPGYRVPSWDHWNGVIYNNAVSEIGTWTNGSNNYSSGKKFGTQLMLPATGIRTGNGVLYARGAYGGYWSSTLIGGVYGQGCCSASALRIYAGGYDLAGYFGNGINEGLSVRCIAEAPGAVETLECGGTTVEGPISIGLPVADVNITIPYTGGNGESYAGQTMNSTGVTGLTATLASGNFTVGSNNLRYNVSGIPASAGTAIFSLNIGGQTCNLEVPVSATPVCRAKASSWSYINFMCYNLGAANTAADPFTPSWEINGGYWQWGRKEQAAAGPIGPGSGQANEGAVGGWNTATAPYGSWWPDYKSSSDPCPAGYIVPSSAQWGAVIANNPITDIGTWASSSSNYSSGKKIGDYLMLPAAGIRSNDDGTLYSRGIGGFYWSSTGVGDYGGRSVYLLFYNSFTNISDIISSSGLSVRCIRYYGN